jgi:hypothetical protein
LGAGRPPVPVHMGSRAMYGRPRLSLAPRASVQRAADTPTGREVYAQFVADDPIAEDVTPFPRWAEARKFGYFSRHPQTSGC